MDMRKWMMMRQDGDPTPEKRDFENPPTSPWRYEPRQMERIGFSTAPEERSSELSVIRGGASGGYHRLDEETVRDWMARLRNTDGSTGPHWTMEQTTQVMRQKGVECDPLEFWAAMNMMYSDYLPVAKKANANNIDFYVNLAKAFLDDKDAAKGKLAHYYEYIVGR